MHTIRCIRGTNNGSPGNPVQGVLSWVQSFCRWFKLGACDVTHNVVSEFFPGLCAGFTGSAYRVVRIAKGLVHRPLYNPLIRKLANP